MLCQRKISKKNMAWKIVNKTFFKRIYDKELKTLGLTLVKNISGYDVNLNISDLQINADDFALTVPSGEEEDITPIFDIVEKAKIENGYALSSVVEITVNDKTYQARLVAQALKNGNSYLPYIGINTEIEDIFVKKATSILVNAETSTEYVIYNIDYAGYINGNILSLVIKATLKEGSNPQRIMYLGYNYNLQTGTKINLEDYMSYKNITSTTLQNKINREIQEISQKTQDLNDVGFSVYTRDPDSDMYKLENITNYFYGPDNYIYIVFAYGNNNYTSETDVIVF